MTTQYFIDTLIANPNRKIQFEYAPGKFVRHDFHLTEIKNVQIQSVDCGGLENNWKETVVQVWEAPTYKEDEHMITDKAISIVNIVKSKTELIPDVPVKIEYGNAEHATVQFDIGKVIADEETLTFQLSMPETECKAIGRGETCGTPKKQELALATVGGKIEECDPNSGCCS